MKAYTQANGFVHGSTLELVVVELTLNLAYRFDKIRAATKFSTPDEVFQIDYAEDLRGRYTKRDFSFGTTAQPDAHYQYDHLSRVTCMTASPTTGCPASGIELRETLAYNASGDRTSLTIKNAAIGPETFATTFQTVGGKPSDRIAKLTKSNAHEIAFAWDDRGNRLSDDDTEFLDDARVIQIETCKIISVTAGEPGHTDTFETEVCETKTVFVFEGFDPHGGWTPDPDDGGGGGGGTDPTGEPPEWCVPPVKVAPCQQLKCQHECRKCVKTALYSTGSMSSDQGPALRVLQLFGGGALLAYTELPTEECWR